MKRKSLSKELSLNKKTIVNLNMIEKKEIYGGKPQTWFPSCKTCIVECVG